MQQRLPSSMRSVTAFLHAAACVVGLAMLLSFPALKPHQFAAHFRAPEVRRVIERHSSVCETHDQTPTRIAQSNLEPVSYQPVELGSAVAPALNFEVASQVPLARMFRHLKLGLSRPGESDPLL